MKLILLAFIAGFLLGMLIMWLRPGSDDDYRAKHGW